ncbi:ABC transporter substrate binding protein [Methyloglobulus sp.]|uniref:ABC transporter substrate-binding protein n=1 Tax=Methyloglobulus sp. TaxID=2518622 RepID=UPI0032B7D7A5
MLLSIQSKLHRALGICTNCRGERQTLSCIFTDGLTCSRFMEFNVLTPNNALHCDFAPSPAGEGRGDDCMDAVVPQGRRDKTYSLETIFNGFLKRLFATFILFWLWSTPLLAAKTATILVIASSSDTPYQEAIRGFKAQISAQTQIKFTELTLTQGESPDAKEIERIKPDLIYALGGEATNWTSLQTSRIPIVSTMVLKDEVIKKSANMTGVSLSYPLTTQFQWLRKFFPLQKAVAILYNPDENAATIQAAKAASQQAGFNLTAIEVKSPKELPYALDQLANNIEILFAIPDETVMSVNTAKEVLLATFSNKVPLIGLSDNWVKSGAFYALSWDYEDLGKQCADLAQKILAGAPVGSVHPEHARKITYTINTKIAEHMNLDIPEQLLNNAKLVFN